MPTRVMFTRRRSESLRSNADSVAPVDELTSWLGDDVCTTCGSNVQAGQLYCSQQCRDEDAQANVQLYEKASTSAPVFSQRGSKRLSKTSPDASDLKDEAQKSFRYVCPPSPNILARYGAHLTSPALKALDRRASTKASSANGAAATEMTSASEREWSSSEKSLTTKRRSSSRSTYSSTSEAPSSTPSTPSSPLGRSRAIDELDDLESTDFNLPPSVHYPPSAVYLGGAQAKTLRRSPNQRRVPLPSAVMQPPPPPSATARRESSTSMSFARRPSRTSLPAPVLFTSPVLATTTMKASSSQRGSSKQRRPSSNGSNGASAAPSSWQTRSHRHESSNETATAGSSPNSQQKRLSIATTIPLGLIRRASTNTQNDQRKSSNVSPHSVSASSSAGKTLRAVSPSSTAVSFSSEFATFAAPPTCGRFGCQGLSNSNANAADRENSSTVTMLSHKHTHSANANLHLLGQKAEVKTPAVAPPTNAAAAKLKMTPLLGGNAKLGQEPSDEASAAEREADRTVKSPPRGRSKARGRSSTSRRSPSPPRGIARRGQSEDVAAYMRDYAASTDDADAEASAISPRSNPIRVSRTARHIEHNVSDADDENDDERSARPRRGRSPTERVGRAARKTPFPVAVTDKAAPATVIKRAESQLTNKESGGYDDVDLDGI